MITTYLTRQADHAGKVDALKGAVQDANGHDEGNGIALDGARRPDNSGHQECDERPADGGEQDDALTSKAIAEIAAHNLCERVAPEEGAKHGA